MKKLTAGIFATILGLTAVDAFAATAGTTVASTNYVKQAMQAVSGNVSGLETRVSANETAIDTLNEEQDIQDAAIKAAADAAAEADAKAVANTALIGTVEEGKTVVEMIGDAKTAVSGDVSSLAGRVTTAEGKIATAEGEIDALQAADVTINAALDTKATIETVNAIDGRVTTAEGKITTAESDINSLNEALSTKANASELTYYVKWENVDDDYNTEGIQ